MLHLHLAGDDRENEAAHDLAGRISKAWPHINEDPDNDIRILSGARLHGQRRADLDLLVLADFKNPQSYDQIFALPGTKNSFLSEQGDVRSLCFVIELKDHYEDSVRFEGNSAIVKYPTEEANATKQGDQQRYALKDYLKGLGVQRTPTIASMVWLRNCHEHFLPARPHNIVGKDTSWDMMLSTLACDPINRDGGDPPILDFERMGGSVREVINHFTQDTRGRSIPSQDFDRMTGNTAKPPGPIDTGTEIALQHGRHHSLAGVAEIVGMAERMDLHDRFHQGLKGHLDRLAQGLKSLSGREAEEVDERAKDSQQLLAQVSMASKFMRNAIYGSNLGDDERSSVALLYKREKLSHTASTMIDLAREEARNPVPLASSRAMKCLRAAGLPGLGSESASAVAWEGYRTYAAAVVHDPSRFPTLKEMNEQLVTLSLMGDHRKRDESTLVLLRRLDKELGQQKTSHELVTKQINTARDNIQFATKWLATGRPPLEQDARRSANHPSQARSPSAERGARTSGPRSGERYRDEEAVLA